MCDTLFVKTPTTSFFGKNSDRSCNEPNLTVYFPHKKNTDKVVKLTYISIPQVPETNSMILIKPSWTFGAEMGINQHGVCIGNEALFTKSKNNKIESIIGMDYVRLALERGNTARECCQVMIDLLSRYGQGGNCGFDKDFFYDNSYLVSDKDETYILQTVGKEYYLQKTGDQANISNRLALGDKKYQKSNHNFLYTHFSGSNCRQDAVTKSCEGVSNLSQIFDALRQHNPKDAENLFDKGSVSSVCMHQSPLGDQTTGSLVVEFGAPVIWTTGCSLPCLSVYKPVFISNPYAPCFDNEQRSFIYWQEREFLIRTVSSGWIDMSQYKNKLYQLQEHFINDYYKLNLADTKAVSDYCASCHYAEQKFVDSFADEVNAFKSGKPKLNKMWKKYNKRLGRNVFYSTLADRKL